MNTNELIQNSSVLRKGILDVCYAAKAGHVGGSLSCIDILNVLYNHEMKVSVDPVVWDQNDRFILSKGHVAEALYVTLANKGFITQEQLLTYTQYQSNIYGHPSIIVPGVLVGTGALGHGLSIGVGVALADKMNKRNQRTYVLLGDGELAEGSNWEAAMSASHYQLDQLIVIVDKNGLQITNTTDHVMSTHSLSDKWKSFGFTVIETNGNDVNQLVQSFEEAWLHVGKPTVIIAHTTKGKGVSFMENQLKWHHGVLSDEQYRQASKEVGGMDE